MRGKRLWIVLALALVSGGAAGYLALTYMRQPADTIEAAPVSTTEVAVAARDLPVGTVIGEEDVRLIDWPSEVLPEGYTTSPAEVIGHGLITDVRTNEPLLATKLALKEAGGGLPIIIPEGMRAVSVKVDEVVGVAGFVLPATRVDVLVTLDQQAMQTDPIAKLILQNRQVLAAGQTIQRDANGEPQNVTVITLLVDPEEAEKLTLSATKGKIQLALRNTLDMDTVSTKGIQATNLVKGPAKASPRRVVRSSPRPRGTTIEVYKGSERSTTNIGGGS